MSWRLRRKIKKIKKRTDKKEKALKKERDDLKIFLSWLMGETRELTEEGDEVMLYSAMRFKIHWNDDGTVVTAFVGKQRWSKDDFIDTLYEKEIDLAEFRQTVEKNFLEFLEKKKIPR